MEEETVNNMVSIEIYFVYMRWFRLRGQWWGQLGASLLLLEPHWFFSWVTNMSDFMSASRVRKGLFEINFLSFQMVDSTCFRHASQRHTRSKHGKISTIRNVDSVCVKLFLLSWRPKARSLEILFRATLWTHTGYLIALIIVFSYAHSSTLYPWHNQEEFFLAYKNVITWYPLGTWHTRMWSII